ncbi:MAG: HAD family hydrolase [Actinomycetota bacterium]
MASPARGDRLDGLPGVLDRGSADWMRALAEHVTSVRRRKPDAQLCVVFDIDGTILDLRHQIVHVLYAYDRARGTELFHGLVASDVTVSENHVDRLLETLDVPVEFRSDVAAFYLEHLWDRESLFASNRPYQGVLGVIRWFQIQPGAVVAINTRRPQDMRSETQETLNALGAPHRVRFDPELVFMRDPEVSVPDGKARALDALAERGLHVVAVVDNEPDNLHAMAQADPAAEALFLHADTIFESRRRPVSRLVAGKEYGLSTLVCEEDLTSRVVFVWHGVNDERNLRRFLASGVRWAEMDVRRDPLGRLVLRHDDFEVTPWNRNERPSLALDQIRATAAAGRSAKIDLKENGETLREVLDELDRIELADDRLWFNADIQALGPEGFAQIRERHPAATISCPVDFVVPLLLAATRSGRRRPRDAQVLGSHTSLAALDPFGASGTRHRRGSRLGGEPVRGARPGGLPRRVADAADVGHRRLQLPAMALLRHGFRTGPPPCRIAVDPSAAMRGRRTHALTSVVRMPSRRSHDP